MKLTAFLIFLAALLLSCSNSGSKTTKSNPAKLPYHIDLTKSEPRDLFLSEFAEDVSYIPLESKTILVGGWCTVKAGNDCYIINDHAQALLIFSGNGKFLNKIGMIGRGPLEYPYVSVDYQIDPHNNEVSVPLNSHEVNIYNLEGKFLRHIQLPEFRSNAIIQAHSRFFVSRKNAPIHNYIPLEAFLNDGTKSKEYSFPLPALDESPTYAPYIELSLTPDNDVIVNILCHDTTFIVSEQGDWKPFIVYNRGPGKIPEKETFFGPRIGTFPDNYYTVYLKDLGKILVMVSCHGAESYFCYFNKRSGELFRFENTNPTEGAKSFSIQNDLDGGPGLIYHHSISGHYLYCVHQAIDLIEWKKSDYFDRIEPKYPEKKKKLFAMIDSLKPDDNPVIMIVKLKE